MRVETHYPVGKVAKVIGVHPRTLQRWCIDGKVQCIKTPGGHRRIPMSEVSRLLQVAEVRSV